MSKIYQKEQHIIDNKKVEISYIFDENEYSEKDFKGDFEQFIKWRKGLFNPEDFVVHQPPLINIPQEKVINAKVPEFDYFKRISYAILSKIVVYCLQNMPNVITSNPFIVEVKIGRAMWEGVQNSLIIYEEISNLEHMYLGVHGQSLTLEIVVPYFLVGKVSTQFHVRSLYHEFQHQVQIMRTKREWAIYNRIKNWAEKELRLTPAVLKLYYCLFELMKEAEAQLVETRNLEKRVHKMEWTHTFKKNLMKMVKIENPKVLDDFYNNVIDEDKQLYFNGLLMCVTIAFALAKRENKAHQILLYKLNRDPFPLKEWDEIMSKEKQFIISKIPDEYINKSLKLTESSLYRDFIRKYEWACDELSISKKNRVVTWQFFNVLKKTALKYYEKEHRKKAKKEGF